ncbi:MAG TPA: hypothetical protein VGG39_09325 [Polyangiaceae bacterium]|jgi:hypothetical protein
MANEVLVSTVKSIVASMRAGKTDEAYAGYRALFASPAFATYEANDQRQALRLMVHAKGTTGPLPAGGVEAHRAALAPLGTLAKQHKEPADLEMLGMCQVAVGDEAAAGVTFREALALERERNAQSDLCGVLMKRVSML